MTPSGYIEELALEQAALVTLEEAFRRLWAARAYRAALVELAELQAARVRVEALLEEGS